MAKSPITSIKKKANPPRSKGEPIEYIDMVIVLDNIVGSHNSNRTVNLKELCYLKCDLSMGLATPCRRKMIKNFHKEVIQDMKDGFSPATTIQRIDVFRRYLISCDTEQVNPFSEEGYRAFHKTQWRAVSMAIETKKYLFQYDDGEELGLKEDSVRAHKVIVDSILNRIGFNVDRYQSSLKKFGKGLQGSTLPYTSSEWQQMLRRLNFYFTNLATQLIAYRDKNPTLPPPSVLKGIVIDVIDGKEVAIDVTAKGSNIDDTIYSPFNQAMMAGYLLFAYYTAFNTSSILEVRHPLSVVKEERAGRTSRTVHVKSYKARSSSEVRALFESVDESLHQCVNDDNDAAGIVIANIDKRETNGIEDGVTFIEVLSTLSEMYSTKEFGKLFYFYFGNETANFYRSAVMSVSINLGLHSSSSRELADYFIELWDNLLDKNVSPRFSTSKLHYGGKVVKKTWVEHGKRARTQRLRSLAFGALTCLTDKEINGIVMPLTYGTPNGDGDIKITFTYDDGSKGEFTLASKYKKFLQNLEAYSDGFNPVPKEQFKGGVVTRTPYLLQVGSKFRTKRWNTPRDMLTQKSLAEFGIYSNDFYLSLATARIRTTTSHQEYSEADNGFFARQILQHSLETQLTKYVNGNPEENSKIVSQGLNCLMRIAAGQSRNDAVKSVKKELNIPVLAYEEYKARNMPTNPNGILCDGVARIVGNDGTHYGAKKFAQKEIDDASIKEVPCFQHDMCVKCKSAELVDDAHAIYKYLSFIETMEDAIHLYPDRASAIESKIDSFYEKLDALPESTLNEAEDMLDKKGRYFMFEDHSSVSQYI